MALPGLVSILMLFFSLGAGAAECSYDQILERAKKRYPNMNFEIDQVDTEIFDYPKGNLLGRAATWALLGNLRISVLRKGILSTEMTNARHQEKLRPRSGTGTYYCFFNKPLVLSCANVTVKCDPKPWIFRSDDSTSRSGAQRPALQ